MTKKTETTNVRAQIASQIKNGGPASRLQKMIAERSPVKFGRGDPLFDSWAPGGTFNKSPGKEDK
jgi:hypothetical protein